MSVVDLSVSAMDSGKARRQPCIIQKSVTQGFCHHFITNGINTVLWCSLTNNSNKTLYGDLAEVARVRFNEDIVVITPF